MINASERARNRLLDENFRGERTAAATGADHTRAPLPRQRSKERLSMLEIRVPLLDEGTHSFLLVRDGEHGVKQATFETQTL